MEELAILSTYSFTHPEWFETPERYQPTDDHLSRVKDLVSEEWVVSRSGVWYSARPAQTSLPSQGWKIHVSGLPANSTDILAAAVPVLVEEEVPFKFAVDRRILRLMNSGSWPRGGAGKFMAAYPRSEDECDRLLRRLAPELRRFQGPYILSDRRYDDVPVLYYRYGAFQWLTSVEPDGTRRPMISAPDGQLVPDERQAFWCPPPWVTDPFQPRQEKNGVKSSGGTQKPSLQDGRYEIDRVLKCSTKGGVYLGRDRQSGRRVVIKEARPHTGLDLGDADAVSLRRKEYEILRRLEGLGIAPAPIDFFYEWEHGFLVEEHVDGIPLGPLTTRTNPVYFLRTSDADLTEYLTRLNRVLSKVAQALELMHARDIVYGDLSLLNILVSGDGDGAPAVTLIDFEAAARQGVDHASGTFTPGMSSPVVTGGGACTAADDWYALGRVAFASLLLVPSVVDLDPPATARFLAELQSDLGIPSEFASIVSDLTTSRASRHDRPHPSQRFLDPRAATAVVPRRRWRASTLAELDDAVTASIGYLLASVDTSRRDRLVPADPAVFGTNPMSLAHGAAGIALALQRLHGEVPAPIRDWMLAQEVTGSDYPPSLHHGLAGIGWVYCEMGLPEVGVRLIHEAAAHPLAGTRPDVSCGSAGVGLSLLRLWFTTRDSGHLERAAEIGDRLLATRNVTEAGSSWPRPDGRAPVGYGMGASGIALFLLLLSRATGERRYLDAGRSALQFDLSNGRLVDERFLSFPGQTGGGDNETLRQYWLAGSAGVAAVALRYWYATGDETYRHALDRILIDCARKYAVHAGLFEGLAGLANVLVDAFRFTGEAVHLREAEEAARGVLLFAVPRPEGLAFPGAQNLRFSCDYATGTAGIALALDRVSRPERESFELTLDELLGHSFDGRRATSLVPAGLR